MRMCKLRAVKQCLPLVLETFWGFRAQIYLNSLPERKWTYRKLWPNQDTLSVLSKFQTGEFISPLGVGPDLQVCGWEVYGSHQSRSSLQDRLFRARRPTSERRMARHTAQGRQIPETPLASWQAAWVALRPSTRHQMGVGRAGRVTGVLTLLVREQVSWWGVDLWAFVVPLGKLPGF